MEGNDDDAQTDNVSGALARTLAELEALTPRLQRLGFLLLLMCVGNVVLFVTLLQVVNSGSFSTQVARSAPYAFASLIVSALTVFGAAIFERLRKQGYVIYEEISEELQARYRNERGRERFSGRTPSLPVRLAMRKFHAATSVPLVPGRYGPVVYVAVNVTLALLAFSAMYA